MKKNIKEKIEEDVNGISIEEMKEIFDNQDDDFIDYYNKAVLTKKPLLIKKDIGLKETINEFRNRWRLGRAVSNEFLEKFCKKFDNDYNKLKKEIMSKKDIKGFLKECHMLDNKDQISFCSKLFHTFLPKEFPPIDTAIREHFKLKNSIDSLLKIKNAYQSFIQENPKKMAEIRGILPKNKFGDVSDIRILDMCYWHFSNKWDRAEKILKDLLKISKDDTRIKRMISSKFGVKNP